MLDPKIRTFLKVAELNNYTRAAVALNLTQPAVSQQIRRLEEHYGTRLIDGSGKGIRITEAGEALIRYARFQLGNEEQLIEALKRRQSPLRIGATLSIADYYLPELLGPYLLRQVQPVSVTVKNTQAILEDLLSNRLDCAFVEGIFDKSQFCHEAFVKARFIAVARRDHPLAGLRADLAMVHQHPLILREVGSGTREIYENYLYEHNDSIASAVRIIEVSSFGLIKELLRQTDGISFLYEGVVREEMARGDLIQLQIPGFSILRPLYFIHPINGFRQERNAAFYRELLED